MLGFHSLLLLFTKGFKISEFIKYSTTVLTSNIPNKIKNAFMYLHYYTAGNYDIVLKMTS